MTKTQKEKAEMDDSASGKMFIIGWITWEWSISLIQSSKASLSFLTKPWTAGGKLSSVNFSKHWVAEENMKPNVKQGLVKKINYNEFSVKNTLIEASICHLKNGGIF